MDALLADILNARASARPVVMGILNITPDSFSDGGNFRNPREALARASKLIDDGAEIIDIGAESTRPGSDPVPAEAELDRILPVIRELARELQTPISVDTQKAQVAEAALEAGAEIINDVSALRTDPAMAGLAASSGAAVVLMHMQGEPKTMQLRPRYDEVVREVTEWLAGRVEAAVSAGIPRQRLLVDPGFGFGKTLGHNLELLRRLDELHRLGLPLVVGTSRKSMIGAILNRPVGERLYGTLATVACAAMAGCHVLRVHEVRPALEVVKVCEAVRRGIDYDDG